MQEGRKRRRERNTSSCSEMTKISTGRDRETPLNRRKRNHKMTSREIHPEEKGITELSSFLKKKKKEGVLMNVNKHTHIYIYTHTHVCVCSV